MPYSGNGNSKKPYIPVFSSIYIPFSLFDSILLDIMSELPTAAHLFFPHASPPRMDTNTTTVPIETGAFAILSYLMPTGNILRWRFPGHSGIDASTQTSLDYRTKNQFACILFGLENRLITVDSARNIAPSSYGRHFDPSLILIYLSHKEWKLCRNILGYGFRLTGPALFGKTEQLCNPNL